MAKNKKKKKYTDPYTEMYEKQLKKFESMDPENGTDENNELRFYTEEELEAIEQAKRDAARQAYQDAYLDEYNKTRNRVKTSSQQSGRGGSPRGGAHHPDVHRRRRATGSSSMYARQAREQAQKKRGQKPVQFGSNNNYRSKKRGAASVVGGIFRFIFVVILVLALLFQILIFRYISLVDSVKTGERQVTNASLSSEKVTNILLIGSDTRDEDERGRTDSIILLSINRDSDRIVMTSLMRDSYVEIPGHGWNKLNAAYSYGGAELLMDTVALNFDVKVDRYVYISFFSFINIVDAVGGINLDISDKEAEGMIPPMAEQNKYLGNKKGTDYLSHGGKKLHVNGNQALAYARLRYVGNADFERTSRQRTVIRKIIAKAKTLDPLSLDSFLKVSCGELTTNMSKGEMYLIFYKLLFSLGYDMDELRIPVDGAYSYGNHDGQSTLDLDFDACTEAIRETVYE